MEDIAPAINELSQENGEVPPEALSPDINQETAEAPSRIQRLVDVTRRIGHAATRGSQTALVLLQVSPANEVVRFGAFGAGEAMTHSPAMGALSYGLATLGVEVTGALAGAPLLDTGLSERITGSINKRLSKAKLQENEQGQLEYSKTTKLAMAFIGGTVPAMALEKLEDPTRTAEYNRRFGLWTSAWLAGACAVQGAAMSEGVDVASSNTKLAGIAAGIAAAGGAAGWLKRRLALGRLNRAQQFYLENSDTTSSSQKLGLGKEELAKAATSKGVINAEVQYDKKKYLTPVLVPTKELYWYNQRLLDDLFPDADTYFFTQIEPQDAVVEATKAALKNGGVVIAAESPRTQKLLSRLQTQTDEDHPIESSSLQGAYLNQYVGSIEFDEEQEFHRAPDAVTQYRQAVKEGALEDNSDNGASITDVIADEDANRLWEIYQKPFRDISTTSPINAGFDKQGFHEALKDPSIVKVVNRKDGVITTLALFGTDIKSASWLSGDYFAQAYPEAHETNNIFLFLGIVSDENMRGNDYSLELINLLMKVAKLRSSKALITFECNEVSSQYLPKIVDNAINSGGTGNVTGLDEPVDQTKFSYIRMTR